MQSLCLLMCICLFQRILYSFDFLLAREHCIGLDSDLVVINSFDESKYIFEIANTNLEDLWIGISENVTMACFYLIRTA